MTLDELYNLSRDESMERLKDESRSQAKRRMYGGAALLLIVIVALIIAVIEMNRVRIISICQFLAFSIAGAWMALNNYRLLKKVDSLNTPEQLLHWYEKTLHNNRKPLYLGLLALVFNVVDPYAFSEGYWDWALVDLTIVVALVAFLIYSYFKGHFVKYKTERDEEIIRRLHDLIDMK